MTVDPEAILAAIQSRLPKKTRWLVRDIPEDYDFSIERYGAKKITDHHAWDGQVPEGWSDSRVIGGIDYNEGGGAWPFIVVRENDGCVWGLHVDDVEEMFFNSSLDRFIRTFTLFDSFLRGQVQFPPDMASQVRDLDPDAFPRSYWRELIDHINSG